MIEECFFKQHPRAKNLTDDGKERKERIVEKVLFKEQLFYQAILPLIKNYVVLFQSNVPLVPKLHDRHEQLLRYFLSCFNKHVELVDKSDKPAQSTRDMKQVVPLCSYAGVNPYQKFLLATATVVDSSKSVVFGRQL